MCKILYTWTQKTIHYDSQITSFSFEEKLGCLYFEGDLVIFNGELIIKWLLEWLLGVFFFFSTFLNSYIIDLPPH
jgi:hypothetical protein